MSLEGSGNIPLLSDIWPPGLSQVEAARGHLSLAEVGTDEFLQRLTTQITEMVSAKITQGKDMRRWVMC